MKDSSSYAAENAQAHFYWLSERWPRLAEKVSGDSFVNEYVTRYLAALSGGWGRGPDPAEVFLDVLEKTK